MLASNIFVACSKCYSGVIQYSGFAPTVLFISNSDVLNSSWLMQRKSFMNQPTADLLLMNYNSSKLWNHSSSSSFAVMKVVNKQTFSPQRPPASHRCHCSWPVGSRTTLWTACALLRWRPSTLVLRSLRFVSLQFIIFACNVPLQ